MKLLNIKNGGTYVILVTNTIPEFAKTLNYVLSQLPDKSILDFELKESHSYVDQNNGATSLSQIIVIKCNTSYRLEFNSHTDNINF